MQIFKFGGASLNTANAVKNMTEIVCDELEKDLIVIVSAMGKTTNALEVILEIRLAEKDFSSNLNNLEKYHLKICEDLFRDPDHSVFDSLSNQFEDLEWDNPSDPGNPGPSSWTRDPRTSPPTSVRTVPRAARS